MKLSIFRLKIEFKRNCTILIWQRFKLNHFEIIWTKNIKTVEKTSHLKIFLFHKKNEVSLAPARGARPTKCSLLKIIKSLFLKILNAYGNIIYYNVGLEMIKMVEFHVLLFFTLHMNSYNWKNFKGIQETQS